MRIDLHETLRKIEKNLPEDKVITFKMLEQAYGHTMRLRSQILSVMYDMVDFGPAKRAIAKVIMPQAWLEAMNLHTLSQFSAAVR